MSELWLAVRDGIGLHSKVLLDGDPVRIQDLPPGKYDLIHEGNVIADRIGLDRIPGFLLDYCGDLSRDGYAFSAGSVYEKVSNLEILARTSTGTENS